MRGFHAKLNSIRSCGLICLTFLIAACDDDEGESSDKTAALTQRAKKSPQEGSAAADEAKKKVKVLQGSDEPGSEGKAKAAGEQAEGAEDCPKGKYEFDYKKVDLQGLMSQGGMKVQVLKQQGKAVCTFDAPPPGTWACVLSEPNIAEVKVDQTGIPMVMKLKMSGKASIEYKADGPGRFTLVSSDLSAMKMEGSMNLAGNEIPLPLDKFPKMFGEDGTSWSYECRGDELYMKTEVPGGSVIEHHLKRL